MNGRDEKPVSRGNKRPVWQLVLMDLLLTGLVLCVFALFHHVIPAVRRQIEGPPEPVATVRPPQMEEPAAADEPASEPDDWKTKFAEHFSDSVVLTDSSYSSPDISVQVRTFQEETEDGHAMVCYVADFYIASLDCFQTCFSEDHFEPAETLAERSGAVVAVNGDYASAQGTGLLVRNGEIFETEQTLCDICVLYYDGSVETWGAEDYDAEEILSRDVYQSWRFGPELLEKDGTPKTEFNTSTALLARNPRTGFGYFEPGHYCFVVVDGRQADYSYGASMADFAGFFSRLGCKAAYNLDGGASSVMVLNGKVCNVPCNGGRNLGDMLLIAEPEPQEGMGEEQP